MIYALAAIAAVIGIGTLIASRKPKNNNVLFIGDSITADPSFSYPALLRKLRPDLVIDVLAKSGATTRWMLQNYSSKMNKQYGKVFIYGGVNDAYNQSIPVAATVRNVQDMVDAFVKTGAEVYVILGYEPRGFMDYNPKYEDLQKQLSSRITKAVIIPKINLGVQLTDGIHPNASGQKILAAAINSYL